MNDDLSMKAAEYVLGTLDRDERASFARQLASDSAARALVADWEGRLAPIASVAASVDPGAGLWSRIEGELDAMSSGRNVISINRSVARWRVATIAMGAIAASLAVFAVVRGPEIDAQGKRPQVAANAPQQSAPIVASASQSAPESAPSPPPRSDTLATAPSGVAVASASAPHSAPGGGRPQAGSTGVVLAGGEGSSVTGGLAVDPRRAAEPQATAPEPKSTEPKSFYVASLAPAGEPAGLVARLDQASRNLTVYRLGADVPAGKSLAIWLIGADRQPKALGLMSGASAQFQLPADVAVDGSEVAASIEESGAVADRPAGAFVFRGMLIRE